MTPDQIKVYDTYPQWFAHLLNAVDAISSLPLDEMLNANARITLTGTLTGQDFSEPADPIATARQRRLIELAAGFRNAVRAGENAVGRIETR